MTLQSPSTSVQAGLSQHTFPTAGTPWLAAAAMAMPATVAFVTAMPGGRTPPAWRFGYLKVGTLTRDINLKHCLGQDSTHPRSFLWKSPLSPGISTFFSKPSCEILMAETAKAGTYGSKINISRVNSKCEETEPALDSVCCPAATLTPASLAKTRLKATSASTPNPIKMTGNFF